MASTNYTGSVKWEISGNLITGIAKLAQIFVLRLLTSFGSKAIDPEEGASLLKNLSGNYDEARVRHAVNIAIAEVVSNMEEEDEAEMDDEKIEKSSITSIKKQGHDINIEIEVLSVAGDSVTIILPTKNLF
jgi:hypothetical protein